MAKGYAEVLDDNARARQRKPAHHLHHVEIHPEKDKHGKPVKGGGHAVHVVHRVEDGYGEQREERPFGRGEHEQMLAHVANSLKLPEPEGEEAGAAGEEEDGEANPAAE